MRIKWDFRSRRKHLNNFSKDLFNKISIIPAYELFVLSSLEDENGNISESFHVILFRWSSLQMKCKLCWYCKEQKVYNSTWKKHYALGLIIIASSLRSNIYMSSTFVDIATLSWSFINDVFLVVVFFVQITRKL